MHEKMITRRSIPYPGIGASMTVPREIWERTLETFRLFRKKESESLLFWGGIATCRSLQVTGLYLPGHKPQGGRASIKKEQARWLLRTLRERDEKLLAQLHSHPGPAFHSLGDDKMAASFHTGFFSIVAPTFGRGVSDIADCVVFEFDGGRFVDVPISEVHRRIRILPMFEEFPNPEVKTMEDTWIRTTASRLKRRLTGQRRR